MRGGIGYQITDIFNNSGILQIGRSKHAAKTEAREAGARSWGDMGKALAIYSYGTAQSYKDTWHAFAEFTKKEFRLKDMEKIAAEHVRSYLENRIEAGLTIATIVKEAAALCKLESALNLYSQKYDRGNQYDFRNTIREAIKVARRELPKGDPHRAYRSVERVVKTIENDNHRIAAQSQFESGARIHEISLIRASQLLGLCIDDATSEQCGKIEIRGKGGKIRELCLSPSTYSKLEIIIKTEGKFSIDKNKYRTDIRNACGRCGVRYTGSHGLRWTFAQSRMEKLQTDCGKTYEQSLLRVSRDLGHERPDITEHYLR